MSTNITLAISVIGSFISLLLIVNAFFVKELVKSIGEVKLELVKLTTSHDGTAKEVRDNGDDIKDIYKSLNIMRDNISKIQGEMIHLDK